MIKRILFYLLVALAGVLGVSLAHAQTGTPETYWFNGVAPKIFNNKSDPDAVCRAIIGQYNSPSYQYDYSKAGSNANIWECYYKNSSGPVGKFGDINKSVCPASTPYYAGISPASTQAAICSGTPQPGKCDDKNEFIRRWNYPQGGAVTPPPSSWDGCEVQTIKMLVCRKDAAGMTYCMWLVKRTGKEATGTPDTGGSSTPENPKDPPVNSPPIKPPATSTPGARPCPEGTVQAGTAADGVPICMGQGSNPNNPPPPPPKAETSKTETLPDGSTKTTKVTTTTNSDGSKTTDTEVTITKPDGSKETSQDRSTSTNTAGQPGRMDTPQQDQNNLCKQNPTLSVCRESSVAGTCGEITCVGDAIQCATLRAAAAMQCQQKKDLDDLAARPEVSAGNAILGGTDPQKEAIDSALKGSEVDMSQPALDSSGFVSSRSCLAPRSFSAFNQTITVSFDELCDNLDALRYAVLACAWIVAYLIVSRSVLNS